MINVQTLRELRTLTISLLNKPSVYQGLKRLADAGKIERMAKGEYMAKRSGR